MIDWKKWRHVTKLDPDKPITPKDVAAIVDSGTDAIFVSGTQNITKDNVARLVDMLKDYAIPKVLEPAGAPGLRGDLDFIFIPSVFNSRNPRYIVGMHKDVVRDNTIEYWDKVVPEAYIVLNPFSAVAIVTRAQAGLSPRDAAAYAEIADRFFHFPVVYIEYSGTYGKPELVKAVKEKMYNSVLYYGGGIDSREKAEAMAKHANTIVVGNAVYKKGGVEALKETIVK
jgi:phosphoglycerol geranylgeranyltransferase